MEAVSSMEVVRGVTVEIVEGVEGEVVEGSVEGGIQYDKVVATNLERMKVSGQKQLVR